LPGLPPQSGANARRGPNTNVSMTRVWTRAKAYMFVNR